MRRRCAPGLLIAAALAAATAQGADLPLWELGLGAAWVHLPHYRGSDQSRDWLLPVPYAVYRGEILRADRDGARAVLLDSERFDFDISVSAAAPTRSKDNLARAGMADLDPTVEIGPNLNMTLARGRDWKLDLRFPVHAVLTVQSSPQSVGWTASPVINLDLQVAGWNLGVQGGPRWASRRYHGFYYDVKTTEATAARPAYSAEGGYAGWRLTAGASRRWADFWLGAFVRADGVGGAVFDASPLVKQRRNLSYGLAVSWVLRSSDERVARQD